MKFKALDFLDYIANMGREILYRNKTRDRDEFHSLFGKDKNIKDKQLTIFDQNHTVSDMELLGSSRFPLDSLKFAFTIPIDVSDMDKLESLPKKIEDYDIHTAVDKNFFSKSIDLHVEMELSRTSGTQARRNLDKHLHGSQKDEFAGIPRRSNK